MVKKALLIVILLLMVVLLFGCTHQREYRIYVHDYERKLFIRDLKSKDVLTYKDADGFLCLPEEDVRKLMDQIVTDKVYEK